jgi:hypothetical protein
MPMLGKGRTALASLTSLVFVACGGGGGGGSGGGTPTLAPLSITTANAPAVSGEVVNATDAVEGFGDGGPGTILAAVTTTGGDRQSLVDVIRSQLERFSELQNDVSGAVVGVVVGPTTAPCAVSGTTTISGNLADPATVGPGDSLSATFNNCDEGDGSILNGGLSMSIGTLLGDPAAFPFDLTVGVTLNNLTVIEAGETMTGSGDISLALSSSDGVTLTTTLSGNALAINGLGSSGALKNYAITSTLNQGTLDYTLTGSGILESTDLDGSVVFSTPTSFQGIGSNFPYAGSYLITGQNSSVRLTALDDVNVVLEIDDNGDGTVDGTLNTTWAAISG